MNTLIISEKPSVAERIAFALGNGTAKRIYEKSGVSYYTIDNENGRIYIVAAVGHLLTIRQADNARGYPVLNVEWAPSYEVSKQSEFTKKYLDTIKMVSSNCNQFINACDFDIEGTVIGTNIIRFVGTDAQVSSAKRMKFSTTTSKDLKEAYANLMPIDIDNFYAGEARHMLDWLWGINLSRALSSAFAMAGNNKPLSIGRVQGPILALLSKREKEIMAFVPKPFWKLSATIKGTKFANVRGEIFDSAEADKALEETKSNKGIVKKVEVRKEEIWPMPPFDLTTLQLEASRVFRMDPTRTLAIAQALYEHSYISYPRTASQKLPFSLGLKGIIEQLSKNSEYESIAKELIEKGRFKPREGKKEDEAHPAIFPTGTQPKGLSDEEKKVYDLVTRRFLSCFGEPAEVEVKSIEVDFGKERYTAKAAKVAKQGWLSFYPFSKIDEGSMPELAEGDEVEASSVSKEEGKTKPPNRYTKATLIAELEKRGLGTKATRAAIIDTLFKREYITGSSIMVTKFGLNVFEALKENCAMIIDEATTRKLEEDMEGISKRQKTEQEIIEEGKALLLEALKMFDKNKEKIARLLKEGFDDSAVGFGSCPKCGGKLVLRKSKAGKIFIGCSNYPKCTNTYPLPQNATIKPTGKICPYCHTPIVKVFRKGKRPYEMDLDPNCISRKEWGSKATAATQAAEEKEGNTVEKAEKPKKVKAAKKAKASRKTAAKKKKKAEKATKAKKGNEIA